MGFARLRFPFEFLRKEIDKDAAIIRELHVYGKSRSLKNENTENIETQHRGFGKKIMAKVEEIAKNKGKKKILVISGIGVRAYYQKLGYVQEGPYMAKTLI